MRPGIVIAKSVANQVINILKQMNVIDENAKIEQIGENVIIPVLDKKISLPDNIQFKILHHNFEERSNQPSSLKEALLRIFPDYDEDLIPSSYDQIGSIAVIDIKYDNLSIKSEIGEAILSSNSTIKTVYRKKSKVTGKYRIRALELIAGTDDSATFFKEYGITIAVDLKLAYFSPRLATEHARVANLIEEGQKVIDLFGSLAPFSLHIAKSRKVYCETVDINPYVTELIKTSIRLNKIEGEIKIITADAKEYLSGSTVQYDAIIMNHPSGAFPFLESALEVLSKGGVIFYYDFIPMEESERYIHDKLKGLRVKIRNIHIVRQSSPDENHVCVELEKYPVSSPITHH